MAGTVNALSKTTVIVFPAASAPPAEGVTPIAHDAVMPGVCGVPTKVGTATPVVAIVTAAAGATFVPSFVVRTEKPAAA